VKYDVRELRMGEIISRATEILQENFGVLFGIAAIVALPFNLLVGFIAIALVQFDPDMAPEEVVGVFQESGPMLAFFFAGVAILNVILVAPLTQAAITHAVARLYLDREVSIGSAYSHAFSRFLPLFGSWLLAGIAIFGGLLLLVVPGIIFALWFAFVTQVVVLENVSGSAALGRSRELTKGSLGTVFLMGLIVALIGGFVQNMAGLIPQIHAQQIVGAIVQTVVMLFSGAVYVVFYFSQRCKQEEFDLDLLEETFEHGALCHDCGERLPTNVTVCPVCGTAREPVRNRDSWDD
jgi:hypothetical protein